MMNGFGAYPGDGFESRGGGGGGGGLRTAAVGGAAGMMEQRRRQQQQQQQLQLLQQQHQQATPEYGLGFGGGSEGSAFDRGYNDHHRGIDSGGMDNFGGGGYDNRGGIDPYGADDRYGGDDRYYDDRYSDDRYDDRGGAGNFDHRSRLQGLGPPPPRHEERGSPTRFGGGGAFDDVGYGSTRNRSMPQPQASYENNTTTTRSVREFGGASMMMQERNARQQGGGGLYGGGGGGGGGDRRPEPVSFGNDNFQDPLDKDKPSLGMGGGGSGVTKPGVQFCSSHDAVSAKIAAFDGKGGPAAHQPQIEIAPGIMARLRGAKETWECGTCLSVWSCAMATTESRYK
eukprot:scaffold19245_cov199-Amphora_coffeaeformis.AAC.6